MTDTTLSANRKRNSYDLILVIINHLTKIVHYEPIKIIINTLELAKVIIDVVMQYYGLSNSIISDRGAIFIFKFWSLLCYFFGIKRQLSTTFHSQTDGQTKWQNGMMKAYLCAFVNCKQKNLAWLLPMAEFIYNNSENTSTSHILFKLNCGYHSHVFFEDKYNAYFQSFLAKELAVKLRELINVCWQNFLHA